MQPYKKTLQIHNSQQSANTPDIHVIAGEAKLYPCITPDFKVKPNAHSMCVQKLYLHTPYIKWIQNNQCLNIIYLLYK
jgi:hypothetical protein